jgi:hypothetical protein
MLLFAADVNVLIFADTISYIVQVGYYPDMVNGDAIKDLIAIS